MIRVTCINCEQPIKIHAEGVLADYEGFTTDCPDCGKTMIILDSTLKDFNEYLQGNYKSMGVDIDKEKDYTKTYIEV